MSKGEWQTYTQVDGLPSSNTTSTAITSAGGVWAGTSRGAAYFDGTRWIGYFSPSGEPAHIVLDLAAAGSSTIWFGTDQGLSRFDWQTWSDYDESDGLQGGYVNALHLDKRGRLWMGVTGAGSDWAFGNGVSMIDDMGTADKSDDLWQVYLPTRKRMAGDVISAILDLGEAGMLFSVTPEGTVRYQSGSGGLWLLGKPEVGNPDDDNWLHFGVQDGLPSDQISVLAIDSGNRLWMGTPQGLYQSTLNINGKISDLFTDGYTTFDDFDKKRVLSLWIISPDEAWVGTDKGLYNISGTTVSEFSIEDGLPSNVIRSVSVSPEGAVWVATPAGIAVFR